MMSSYDRGYVDRVLAELEGGLDFAAARRRVLVALTWRIRDCPEQQCALWRLARAVDGRTLEWMRYDKHSPFPAPWGWRAERVLDRDVWLVMPVWLYYPRLWWLKRWRAVMPFVRAGFWSVEAGDYLWSGRWRWRWWLGRYPQFRIQHSLPTRLDRLGLWLERRGKQ